MITSAAASSSEPYRGRFAPSPTGPLHAGSLVAALASFLDARHQGGVWRLRFDDIDPPRAVGQRAKHCAALRGHGLHWDEPILYQSEHSERYESALQTLWQLGVPVPMHLHSHHPLKRRHLRAGLSQGGPSSNTRAQPAGQGHPRATAKFH